MLSSVELLAIVGSYILGCFTTGYYLVRLHTGQDIRGLGSGSVGGRNVGRVLGWGGFAVTVGGDFAKGALAVGGTHALGFGEGTVLLVLLAVVVGHVWPVQLGLRGGKGIATTLGALVVYDLFVLISILVLLLCIYAARKNFVTSGLIAITIAPAAPLILGQSLIKVAGLFALTVIILVAHRKNIRDAIAAH
jgi:glycerol-3-phosphate acyltransferase PlsY